MKTKFTFLACLLLAFTTAFAGEHNYWQPVHNDLVPATGKRTLSPDRYRSWVLNTAALRTILFGLAEGYAYGTTMELPMPDGEMRTFRIWASTMMEPALALKYPDIRTFTAAAVDDKFVTAKIDLSPAGFHAMIFDGEQTAFIDPYSNTADGYYISYYKKDHPHLSFMTCQVMDDVAAEPSAGEGQQKLHGATRRNYRLALACTGEYAVAVGGAVPTKASVLAQMVLIMNRVNGVYERDFASTMTLVGNTDTLIFLNGATDPYTNDDGSTMLGQNQTTVTARIGTANYDMGHVFSTGGGGVAGLGVLCSSGNKARGVTGLTNPVGDPFAIDYVAHEMGHQFGSNHTFNSALGACAGNGVSGLAFEPGSGSTIMAYAGICSTDDLQSNSDPYFHAGSLRVISTFITTGTGGTCPTITTSTNVPNTYPDFTQTYSIPLFTPFELTAPAVTDATQDTLTYCWEEWDLGGFGQQWNTTNTLMPYFRSFNPSSSPTRVFPTMNNILAGNYVYKGERLPQAARTLKFIMTTRDIYQGWGCFNSSFDTDTVTLNAVATGDTFRVTSQATPGAINNGSIQTITWNVAGTTAAPISAATVDIYLSVDSGRTFPYVLASAAPNNGSATVVIPAIPASTNKGRIKVKATNNVFFQVNRANITINSVPLAAELLSFEAGINGCTVQLDWQTASPTTISRFEIQRGTDGVNFTTIQTIQASAVGAYHFADEPGKAGSYLYRLKMTGSDERVQYSTVASAAISCKESNNIVAYPNPAHELINISSGQEMVEVSLIAANGQIVYKKSGHLGKHVSIASAAFADGLYLARVVGADGSAGSISVIKKQ